MSTTNDEQAKYGRSSKCCGADIHYDHCTDCQKYCGNGGHEKEPRAPMLGDDELRILMDEEAEDCGVDDDTTEGAIEWRGMLFGGMVVRDYYTRLISSGVLRVVKIIPRSECKEHVLKCKDGMHEAMDTYFHEYIDFCPGCGASITK